MHEPLASSYLSGKTVLVTGAAGFIGSHLCDALLQRGALVVGVDNFITGREENIAHLIEQESQRAAAPGVDSPTGSFQFIQADASVAVERYLPIGVRPDVILHFASPASPPQYQRYPVETYQVNAWGTHELLNYLKEYNPDGRFVFASTSEVYGDPAVHPQVESYWGNVNPNGIRSCYDESKRLGETICGVFQRDFDLDVRIVRIFNTYGPRINPADGRVIPNFVKQGVSGEPLTIYGDGMQTRSYCFVSDLVEGILRLAEREGLSGATVNLGNPDERTTLETAEIVKELTCNTAAFVFKPLPSDDPTRRQPDISLAKKLLEWEPEVDFKTGLKKTISYFEANE
jgi:nucleoside-diphosphate-sugar epimerase